MTEKSIEVLGLEKSYGNVHAVRGIDFYVEKGSLFAFLGTNGAGKSTTIDIICTSLDKDKGMVKVGGYELGKDDQKIREIIGAVFQNNLLDDLLTVEENLRTRGEFYGLKGREMNEAISRVSEVVDLQEFIKRPYGKLSGGQRRRADIARGLIHSPEILFLDEPTTGLDPATRRKVWETIDKVRKEKNMTVFLTTHYMEEAAEADYVVVISRGKIAAQGTPSELKDRYSYDKLILTGKDRQDLKASLDARGYKYEQIADTFILPVENSKAALPIVQSQLEKLDSFEVLKGTLDDAFINISGKELSND